MKTKKGYFCWLLVIFLALSTLVSFGKAGATNCYKLYYNAPCENTDWENWDYINIALHKDQGWEGSSYKIEGAWAVWGNAIYLQVIAARPPLPECFQNDQLLAGIKSGQVKFLMPPPKSKINISKAQGFFLYKLDHDPHVGCWYLEKANLSECPWINEGGSMASEMDEAEMDDAEMDDSEE